jgi:hypothetical protein
MMEELASCMGGPGKYYKMYIIMKSKFFFYKHPPVPPLPPTYEITQLKGKNHLVCPISYSTEINYRQITKKGSIYILKIFIHELIELF